MEDSRGLRYSEKHGEPHSGAHGAEGGSLCVIWEGAVLNLREIFLVAYGIAGLGTGSKKK
jgi:hypothetical protein